MKRINDVMRSWSEHELFVARLRGTPIVRPGKVAYSSGCEARPGRVSPPPGSESLDRWG